MTAEQNFFINLPQGKTTGFCQPINSSVWKDGGDVVDLHEHCKICSVAVCMMFEDEYDETGKFKGKRYTPHKPAWK